MLWDIVRKGKYFPIIPDSTLIITWQQIYDQPNTNFLTRLSLGIKEAKESITWNYLCRNWSWCWSAIAPSTAGCFISLSFPCSVRGRCGAGVHALNNLVQEISEICLVILRSSWYESTSRALWRSVMCVSHVNQCVVPSRFCLQPNQLTWLNLSTVKLWLKTFCHHFAAVWIRTEQAYNSVCALYLNINLVFYMSSKC